MIVARFVIAVALVAAAPAAAQTHDPAMHAMPGMTMSPSQSADVPAAAAVQSAPATDAATQPPPAPTGLAAERLYPPGAMDAAYAAMLQEHGGMPAYMLLFNIAEYQVRNGSDGYRWDGQAWFGGDINRFVLKSEGEGSTRGGLETGEVQALFSHAIGPYFNLQAGLRQDFQPTPARTYATIGVEGVLPYWFETEAAVFLSNHGELLGRLQGYYDQRITQRLILQPRIEANLSAQDIAETGIGAGVSNIELGLRLRYEIRREFAPYFGISYDSKIGKTADFARIGGNDVHNSSIVFGIRMWI